MKICCKCREMKSFDNFYKRSRDKSKYRSQCKQCFDKVIRDKNKKYPWKTCFSTIKIRCNNPNSDNYKYYGRRGIKCLITLDEIKQLWNRDKAYLMKKPSIDREDNDGHYIYNNCSFIEININCVKSKFRATVQYSLEHCYIKDFISLDKASKETNINKGNIHSCCNNKRKSAGGYIWRYK